MPGIYNSSAPSTHIKSLLRQTHLPRIGRLKHGTAIAVIRDDSQGKVSLHMPQASSVSKWDHRSHLQQMGHVGNLSRREKALHDRKLHPWGWNMGMGTHFRWRIYNPIFMRNRCFALKAFCLKIPLGQIHIQQCYSLFQCCRNKLSCVCHFVQLAWYSLPPEQSTQALPCSCTHTYPTCQPLCNSFSL